VIEGIKEILLQEDSAHRLSLARPHIVTPGALREIFYRPGLPPAPELVLQRTFAETIRQMSD
jgi:hypothetical protein